MDIKKAKQQIKNAMTAYFTKDEYGNYRIPIEKQRPVFLMGPPGIGKTAIIEQIANEMGVGMLSYSMTHHTRQSALGLPVIEHKVYQGREYDVSEYTMSEIIASVYDLMEETGIKEGILFLDEINCVSETLAPCMLQFLQYKMFGQHRVPAGWILVTAGNPPEYNKSVRDFDVVTLDRLKRIDVEPDYEVWKEYASQKGVHPSVMTYLASRKKDFYKVENAADGKRFVTARGWDDLAEMISLYEENGQPVNEKLIIQYLQDPRIARDFAIYYDLFNKYRSDYQVEKILDGTVSDTIVLRAQRASMDERLSLLGLLFDSITSRLRACCEQENVLDLAAGELRSLKVALHEGKETMAERLAERIRLREDALLTGQRSSSISAQNRREIRFMLRMMEEFRADLLKTGSRGAEADFAAVRAEFHDRVNTLKQCAESCSKALEHAFSFCEDAFRDGDEILVFVTELTANYYTARFIGHYGCDPYFLHSKELQFQERRQEILERIEKMDWSV